VWEEVAEEEVEAAGRESVARVCGAGIPGTPLYSYKIITGTEALKQVQKYKYWRQGGRVLLMRVTRDTLVRVVVLKVRF
jgi:hypothetical protein